MENEIVIVVISVLAAFMSSVATVGAAAWLVSGKMNALGGQISVLSARMDGMEQHFNARMDGIETRLGNLERDVHSINEHLRRPSAEQSAAAVGGA